MSASRISLKEFGGILKGIFIGVAYSRRRKAVETAIHDLNTKWEEKSLKEYPRDVEVGAQRTLEKTGGLTVFFYSATSDARSKNIKVRTLDWRKAGTRSSALADEVEMDKGMSDEIVAEAARCYPQFQFIPERLGR